MRPWLDAHLSPEIARWITERFAVEAAAAQSLGFEAAKDREIFASAGAADAIPVTKDSDFGELVERLGPPPRVIHLTCGNTSNSELKRILERSLPKALELLRGEEQIVEMS